MFPPIYPAIAASSACVALLKSGGGELRFYQFGRAPQNVQKPYAVWQRVFGTPANYLGQVPDSDNFTLQVDIYAGSADSARTVAAAIRDAIEPVSYITNWLGESVDPDTGNNRFSLQSEWIVERT
jgi:hypothetical protein